MKELVESIENYIRKPYTDYAVMINGEWGSGKTHFWNHKLRQRIENIANIEGKRYKTIYISLYGINSIEEISKKIFLETNPMISKSLKKFVEDSDGNVIPEYVKTGIDIANLYGAMNTNTQMDFAKAFSTDDKVLCFDDLERANIDIIDILGYINNFVEHDGIKTILICNEKELATKFKNNNIEMKTLIATMLLKEEGAINNEDKLEPFVNKLDSKIKSIFDRTNAYERIKEKLIGECFEYMPEYTYILNGMIMKYEYDLSLSKFLKEEISTIISTFNKTNTKNLRVLKHALNDFERIFTAVKNAYPETPRETLRTLLMFTIAVSFEIKVGSEVKQIFTDVESNEEYHSYIYTSSLMNDQKGYYLREFDTRYFLNAKEEYRFFKFVEIYVRKRIFDEKIFNANMKEMLNQKADKRSDPNYMKLLTGAYWKLSDFDFSILREQVLYDIKEGNVPSKDYVKVFAVYKYLNDMQIITVDMNDIKAKFTTGYKLSLTNEARYKIDLDSVSIDVDAEDELVKEYAEECSKAKDVIYDECVREKVGYLFKNLVDNIDEFYKQMIGPYSTIPVFAKYEMSVLYDRLRDVKNNDLYNIISIMTSRYDGKEELLKHDAANLKKLSEIIDEKADTFGSTIKRALIKNLSAEIKKILKNVKNTEV